MRRFLAKGYCLISVQDAAITSGPLQQDGALPHTVRNGWTENAGPENGGPEIAGPSTCVENAGIPNNVGNK